LPVDWSEGGWWSRLETSFAMLYHFSRMKRPLGGPGSEVRSLGGIDLELWLFPGLARTSLDSAKRFGHVHFFTWASERLWIGK
jgi:hypothetical protein